MKRQSTSVKPKAKSDAKPSQASVKKAKKTKSVPQEDVAAAQKDVASVKPVQKTEILNSKPMPVEKKTAQRSLSTSRKDVGVSIKPSKKPVKTKAKSISVEKKKSQLGIRERPLKLKALKIQRTKVPKRDRASVKPGEIIRKPRRKRLRRVKESYEDNHVSVTSNVSSPVVHSVKSVRSDASSPVIIPRIEPVVPMQVDSSAQQVVTPAPEVEFVSRSNVVDASSLPMTPEKVALSHSNSSSIPKPVDDVIEQTSPANDLHVIVPVPKQQSPELAVQSPQKLSMADRLQNERDALRKKFELQSRR